MVEIELTKKQYDRLPYKTTTITKGRTYGEIIGMLETHGIKDYQFTKFEDSNQLAFPLTINRKGVDQKFLVKLTVPRLMYLKSTGRGRSQPKRLMYLENVSWRIFWWHLKSKLEAIEYGISDEVKEFMYNIHYALEDGSISELSLGETIVENASNLNKLHSLEDKRDKKTIDADYRAVK